MIEVNSPRNEFVRDQDLILEAVREVLLRGNYILGEKVSQFEQEFASMLGVSGCVGVANGTDAIKIALKSLGVRHGDEVITVGNTALATIAGIIDCGAIPVIVDVNYESALLDLNLLELAISPKTKAVVIVHLFGNPVNVNRVKEIIGSRNIKIVEDCAQAHGAKIQGSFVGTLGDIGCFSFYPTKILGAFGDAGAIVSNNLEIIQELRMIREYGWNKDRRALAVVGVNSRMDELQAAILLAKMKRFSSDLTHRESIASFYLEKLDKGIFNPLKVTDQGEHAYHLFVGKVADRDHFMNYLLHLGIKAAIHYKNTILEHEAYLNYIRLPQNGLPVTKKLAREIVSVPLSNSLSWKEVHVVVEGINGFSIT